MLYQTLSVTQIEISKIIPNRIERKKVSELGEEW